MRSIRTAGSSKGQASGNGRGRMRIEAVPLPSAPCEDSPQHDPPAPATPQVTVAPARRLEIIRPDGGRARPLLWAVA